MKIEGIITKVLKCIENILSKNQQIIYDLIDKSSEPLKAYTILFNVQKKGIKAPPQVYRALDKLVRDWKNS